MKHFADNVIERVREIKNPLCVGLDPHIKLIPEEFDVTTMLGLHGSFDWFLKSVIDRLEHKVATVKFQMSLFEQLGGAGISLLNELVEYATERNLFVILDGKRGDIASSAEGYVNAFSYTDLEHDLPTALTINPYMGSDSIDPFVCSCRDTGNGMFVLVRTSNLGAADIQDRISDGKPIFLHVAEMLKQRCEELKGEKTGWSSLGIVMGATASEEQFVTVREALPNALFLIPGYGYQHGSLLAATKSFLKGPNGNLEGGLINASRSIIFPHHVGRTWKKAFDDNLAREIEKIQKIFEY